MYYKSFQTRTKTLGRMYNIKFVSLNTEDDRYEFLFITKMPCIPIIGQSIRFHMRKPYKYAGIHSADIEFIDYSFNKKNKLKEIIVYLGSF